MTTQQLMRPFDLRFDGSAPYRWNDLRMGKDAELEAAGRAMMDGDIAWARECCVSAAKIRDCMQTRAELDVILAGYAERRAARAAIQPDGSR